MSPLIYPVRVFGGGKRVRTADPLLAGQVLYQLSYTPKTLIKSVFVTVCKEFTPHAVINKTNAPQLESLGAYAILKTKRRKRYSFCID